MKRVIIILLAGAFVAGACNKKSGGGVKLRTDTDSVAYIIGMNIAANLMKVDSTINAAAVCEGIRDVFRETPKMTLEEAEAYYLRYVNYALPEKARAYEEQFIADFVKSNRSYARTQSGVAYTVDVLGDQDNIPTADRDSVAVRYVIRTSDGHELFSSYERGDTVRMSIGGMTRGLQESLKLIGKGGKISAWMPSSAAYGAEGSEELGIAPNATLYYEIELLDVDKYANRSRRNNLR